MRIHVTGNAGAGKTTLARELAADLGLPLHHLDSVVWESHWKKTAPDVRTRKISELVAADAWIIEGVSDQVRASADVVLFIDTPRPTCLVRCIKRCFRVGFRTRPELPPNCPEIAILVRALGIVWRFPKRVGAALREESARDGFFVCRDGREARGQLKTHLGL